MKTPRKTSPATLNQDQLIRAAVNLPADKFELGDRVFDIKDLPYDDYITFISYLTPLIEALISKVIGDVGVSIPGIDLPSSAFTATKIVALCGKELPEMVQIICRQTEPDITIETVKELAKRPTVLVGIVLKQITQNGIIKEFTDFFVQVLSVVKPLTPGLTQST